MSILRSIHNVWDVVCYEVGGIGYKHKKKPRREQRREAHEHEHEPRYSPRHSNSIDSFQSDYNRYRYQR